ncbi:MAG: hypothetical protein C5B51_00225 [Terriglobia bacterium]|nr:MAG: hypothetical protein C5B51_00225 [Terriglobia bacterium]
MGRDKAFLPFRGGVLAQFIGDQVAAAAGDATLIGDPSRYASFGYPVIPDRYPGEGPLGGILTALQHSTRDWNLVVACDMPGITSAFLVRLLEAAENSGGEALIPVRQPERPEPLCAVYHRNSLLGLETAFQHGERKIMTALAGMRMVRFPIDEPALFRNLNTPEDWAAYARE